MDSTAHTSHRGSELINKLVSQVTDGFDSPNNP
jgi:hypothetical protein